MVDRSINVKAPAIYEERTSRRGDRWKSTWKKEEEGSLQAQRSGSIRRSRSRSGERGFTSRKAGSPSQEARSLTREQRSRSGPTDHSKGLVNPLRVNSRDKSVLLLTRGW